MPSSGCHAGDRSPTNTAKGSGLVNNETHPLLQGVERLFLDTSPIIYYVQGTVRYFDLVNAIFEHIRSGDIHAYTSTITLVECLVQPYRQKNLTLARRFQEVIRSGINTTYIFVDHYAENAAWFRA